MIKRNGYLIIASLMFFSSNAFADDLTKAFENTSNFWNSLFDLTYGFSLILGIVFSCLAGFEAIAVSKTHGSGQEKSYLKAGLYLLAGAMLISSLDYIHTMMNTLSLDSVDASNAGDIFASNSGVDDAKLKAAWTSVFLFLRFLGFFYTVLALSKLPHIGKKEDITLAGISTKFVGGILLMNMLEVIHIGAETLGTTFVV